MRGSRSKAQQYGGEHTLLYEKEIYILNFLVNFAVRLDPRMSMGLEFFAANSDLFLQKICFLQSINILVSYKRIHLEVVTVSNEVFPCPLNRIALKDNYLTR